MAIRTIDDLVAASVEALAAGKDEGVWFALSATDGRDILTAVADEVDNGLPGHRTRTEFRLNGERVSRRAAELLIAAYT